MTTNAEFVYSESHKIEGLADLAVNKGDKTAKQQLLDEFNGLLKQPSKFDAVLTQMHEDRAESDKVINVAEERDSNQKLLALNFYPQDNYSSNTPKALSLTLLKQGQKFRALDVDVTNEASQMLLTSIMAHSNGKERHQLEDQINRLGKDPAALNEVLRSASVMQTLNGPYFSKGIPSAVPEYTFDQAGLPKTIRLYEHGPGAGSSTYDVIKLDRDSQRGPNGELHFHLSPRTDAIGYEYYPNRQVRSFRYDEDGGLMGTSLSDRPAWNRQGHTNVWKSDEGQTWQGTVSVDTKTGDFTAVGLDGKKGWITKDGQKKGDAEAVLGM